MAVKITKIIKKSIADKNGIKAGDTLININDNEIVDILDFRFYEVSKKLKLDLLDANGKAYTLIIKKSEYDALGLEFGSFLIDEEHSCRNKCIFCFIDQMPPGMRDTLYFKDDDNRLSFLTGNYITMTNMTEAEVDRIIKMHISPINISVHTTNPELRCKMMNNKFAGEALNFLYKLADAEIAINVQIVLCPGINDGEELKRTLDDLGKLNKSIQSIAVVPVGLTKYRKDLYPLNLFNKSSSRDVISVIKEYQTRFLEEIGTRLVYLADEFYLSAGEAIPDISKYEDLCQLENGVGMTALLEDEFNFALLDTVCKKVEESVTIVTGELARPLIQKLLDKAVDKYNVVGNVVAIKNNFFGDTITVSGLVTGRDLIEQLKCEKHADKILIPESMLRKQQDVFLDDIRVSDIEKELKVKVEVVPVEGQAFLEGILGIRE